MSKKARSGIGLSLSTVIAVAAVFAADRVEAETAPPLPSYKVNTKQISVSGVSSGGYMAQQLHVAFSNNITGAGIIAGGPYYCARGSVWIGLYGCMETYFGNPPVEALVETTRMEAAGGAIDDPANLRDDKVYLFHGSQDSQVKEPVMNTLEEYYKRFMPAENVKYEKNREAEHAMITEDYGSGCGEFRSPYINDCDIDVAGRILEQIYGSLNRPVEPKGRIIEFDQSEFGANQQRNSLDSVGHAYIPTGCDDRTECKLHIVFHGCAQNSELIDNQYYTKTGYNKWAESNNIIILYPQVADIPLHLTDFQHSNPQGCWDWWGYTGDNYHRKSGVQMAVVKKMIDRVTGASRAPALARAADGQTATIYEHVIEGRATRCGASDVCAAGSGKIVGSWLNLLQKVPLRETKPRFYEPARVQ